MPSVRNQRTRLLHHSQSSLVAGELFRKEPRWTEELCRADRLRYLLGAAFPPVALRDGGRKHSSTRHRPHFVIPHSACDGDGQSNGLELGDPCCQWEPGKPFPRESLVSDPASATSTTTAGALPSMGRFVGSLDSFLPLAAAWA